MILNRTPSNRDRQRSAGFTLFEMLLSLGLALTLMTILFAALDLHWRFANQGQTEVERAQIARAVLNKMSIDIRSITFRPEEATDTDSKTGDGTEEEDVEATTVVEYSDPAEAFAGDSLGVFGDSQTLILHIQKPIRPNVGSVDLNSGPDADTANPYANSTLRSVSYFLAGGQGALQEMIGDQFAGSTINTEIQGLVRMGGDRFTMVEADANGDLETMSAHAKMLAPEIEAVAFEYFDGVEWLTEWDSEVEQRVPNAIAITIVFKDPDYPEKSITRETPSDLTKEYRMVVPLVISNPYGALDF